MKHFFKSFKSLESFNPRPLLIFVTFFILFTLFFGSFTRTSYSRVTVPGFFSGGGMVLHLFEDKRIGSMRGILYKKSAAYRFSTKLKGKSLYASTLYARSDKLVPYRKVMGSLSLNIVNAGQRVNLEMNIGGKSAVAIFRPVLHARAYSILSKYGNIYCDGERLVVLLEDKGLGDGYKKASKVGWLSRILKKDVTKMPVIGMFFAPGVWYYFQAKAFPERGVWNSKLLHIGGGALDGYLLTATLKAKLENGRLAFSYKDNVGVHRYMLSYSAHGKSCSSVVTRWTSKRRIPSGKIIEPIEETKPEDLSSKEKDKGKDDEQTYIDENKNSDVSENDLSYQESDLESDSASHFENDFENDFEKVLDSPEIESLEPE